MFLCQILRSKGVFSFLACCAIASATSSTTHAFITSDVDKPNAAPTASSIASAQGPAIVAGWAGMDLRLSNKISWTASKVKYQTIGRKSCIAKGRDENGPVELIIAERDGFIAASFRDGSGTRWKSSVQVGEPVVFEQIPAKRMKLGCPETAEPTRDLMDLLNALEPQSNEGGIASTCTDSTAVTVLIVYTPCAASLVGGFGPLAALVDHAELLTNEAFLASAIDTSATPRQIEIIGIEPTIAYPINCGESEPCNGGPGGGGTACASTFQVDLNAVTDPTTALGGLVGQRRNYHQADLVVMLRVPDQNNLIAGLAWRKSAITNCDGALGFTVVDVASLFDVTMAHELGHLFGCCHAPGDQGAYCPISPWSYSNGFRFVGSDGFVYGTIMAYSPATTITYFSNPNISYEGSPTGTSAADPNGRSCDNARLIRETFSDVRCYRRSCLPPPTPLIPSGPVIAWGLNSSSQINVPSTLGNCIKVSAGNNYSAAIQETRVGSVIQAYGPVRTWGAFSSPTPADLGNCKSISAGSTHIVAIKSRLISDSDYSSNNKVAVWGTGTGNSSPSGLGTCSAISAGGSHSLAIQSGGSFDGVVFAWGGNSFNQCGIPSSLGTCIQVAAGNIHSVALTSGQQVRCWGNNSNSQCNNVEGNFSQIAAGNNITVMLRTDGIVLAQGLNANGQATVPSTLGICTAIATGMYHTSAIKTSTDDPPSNYGQLVCWGAGTTTGVNPNYGQSIVPANLGIYSVAHGGYHTLAISYQSPITSCPGDLNGDRLRNGSDLTTLLSGWGTSNGDCNGDGTTNGLDISFLLSGWGTCP